ncbi:MAG TPA: ComF family protein [Candidatus Mcinerneyibacterium sp.]|nr:ComF family protein [Candidatus Mcinerneyibacterium sp.]
MKSLIFPSYCPLCNVILDIDQKGLCKNCVDDLALIGENYCKYCGKELGYSGVCQDCAESRSYFWNLRRSVYRYNDAMAKLVHEFKYKNNIEIIDYFSGIFFEKFREYFNNIEIDYIIPVPVSKKRLKERGYNQVELLIKKFDDSKVKKDILLRTKNTRPQSSFEDDQKRKLNVKDAFKVTGNVDNKNILVVDDIITTGATLYEIGRLLKKSGAAKIYNYTLIRSR